MHPREAHFLKLDASKARAYLGWHPVLPLHQALDWIVEWYRAFQSGADLGLLTRTQIERYEALSQTEAERACHDNPHGRRLESSYMSHDRR